MLLAQLISYVALSFLLTLAGIVLLRLLDGSINTRGLFHKRMPDGTWVFTPERVQLLLFTIATAFTLLNDVMQHLDSPKFPPVNHALIAALGSSHALYLGRKYWTTRPEYLKRFRQGDKL